MQSRRRDRASVVRGRPTRGSSAPDGYVRPGHGGCTASPIARRWSRLFTRVLGSPCSEETFMGKHVRAYGRAVVCRTALAAIIGIAGMAIVHADDWPEIGGAGRLNVWSETGILEKFPAEGLKVLWRTPIKAGYA